MSKAEMPDVTVSIIVPNWNGAALIRDCLESVRQQSYPRVECLVVDDGSTDSSVEIVRREFPTFQVIRLPRNGGFARAANTGMRASQGEMLALLNNDAVADHGWIAELVSALARHPSAGSAASKVLLLDQPDRLNSAGDVFTRAGTPNNRGAWEVDRGQYDAEVEVFGASGAAVVYRRSMLDEIGFFDERFYMYCEDVDLSFRAQRAGYRCVYAPRAVVRHRLSATGGGVLASYQCGRNFIWLLALDVPGMAWRRYGARFVRMQARLAIDALCHFRESSARARLRGQIGGLLTAPRLLAERRRSVANQRVSDAYVLGLLT